MNQRLVNDGVANVTIATEISYLWRRAWVSLILGKPSNPITIIEVIQAPEKQ